MLSLVRLGSGGEVKNRKSSQIHVDGRTETDAVQKSLLFGLAKNISLIIYALIFHKNLVIIS